MNYQYELKKISVWYTARYVGVFGAIVGLVPAGFLIFDALDHSIRIEEPELAFGIALPFLIGGVLLFVSALVLHVYNLMTERVGGIRFDLEYIETTQEEDDEE